MVKKINGFLLTQKLNHKCLVKVQPFNSAKVRCMHDITDNKTFWKTVKPFFNDQIKTKSKITLIEKKNVSQEGQEEIVSKKIITEDQAVAEVFNKFFINIVPNLKISTDHDYDNHFIATDDQVTNSVNTFRNHTSIIMIKNKKKMIKVFPLVL